MKSLFFTNFIVLVTESVLQLTMASYLFVYNKSQPNHNQETKTPVLNAFTWFTVVYSFIALLLLIMFSIFIPLISKEKLESRSMKKKFGHLYDTLKPESQMALSYYLIFIARRMILCAIFLLMQETPAQ